MRNAPGILPLCITLVPIQWEKNIVGFKKKNLIEALRGEWGVLDSGSCIRQSRGSPADSSVRWLEPVHRFTFPQGEMETTPGFPHPSDSCDLGQPRDVATSLPLVRKCLISLQCEGGGKCVAMFMQEQSPEERPSHAAGCVCWLFPIPSSSACGKIHTRRWDTACRGL